MNAMFLSDFQLVRKADESINCTQLSDDLSAIACLSEVAAGCASAAYAMSSGCCGSKYDVDAINAAANIVSKLAQQISNSIGDQVALK